MKKIIGVFLGSLLFQCTLWAGYTHCPAHISQRQNYYKAWKFLKSLQPRFSLDGCSIELHICEMGTAEISQDDIVGDILIKNKHGVEQYITLFFPAENTNSIDYKIDADTTWFNYKYEDRNFDTTDGAKQKVNLKMVSHGPGKQLKRMTLAAYTSNNHTRILGIIPYSYWSICEE